MWIRLKRRICAYRWCHIWEMHPLAMRRCGVLGVRDVTLWSLIHFDATLTYQEQSDNSVEPYIESVWNRRGVKLIGIIIVNPRVLKWTCKFASMPIIVKSLLKSSHVLTFYLETFPKIFPCRWSFEDFTKKSRWWGIIQVHPCT